ncbi:MAG: 23S rRNA (pseudouridine(1915)-N(3))-methyltransferase RlmH [Bacteroidales bacterium]|nr:23S rRNA (pseudouridine(1915)-N(3))-methyltransferase RlmH [Bacteroidales bacterium]
MKVKLLLVGKTEESYLKKGIETYSDRISHYVNFEFIEIPELKHVSSISKEQIKTKEGDLVLKCIKPTDNLILLDEKGPVFNSVDWARHLEHKFSHSNKDIIFVIGGGYGFSESVYDRADSLLSLSKMTFSHQLVRVIFLEQLYRAFTIIRGEPYHHE